MNKLERDYAMQLAVRKAAGEITDWRFEAINFRLANRCWYTPDFVIFHTNGMLETVEVKGFWRDDARVKWKVAAEMYPRIKWTAVTRKNGEWVYERYGIH